MSIQMRITKKIVFAIAVAAIMLVPLLSVQADTNDSQESLVGLSVRELEVLHPCMIEQPHLRLCGYTGILSLVYFDRKHSLFAFVTGEYVIAVQTLQETIRERNWFTRSLKPHAESISLVKSGCSLGADPGVSAR